MYAETAITQANDPTKAKAAATYNAAADHFDDGPLAFWDRYGRRTVNRLDLPQGALVIDVGCGTGASALPAAQAVGPGGLVTGVDLAENLLALARLKARALGLNNVFFERADMESLEFADGHFDAVICVFSIFFVEDMARQASALWRLIRPGGCLAITTWGPRMLEPGSGFFWDAVERERPDLRMTYNPWDRISYPADLRGMLAEAGIDDVEIVPDNGRQLLRGVEDWWTIALGSGFRWTIEQLTPKQARRVRADNLLRLREMRATAVETNVLYALARKP